MYRRQGDTIEIDPAAWRGFDKLPHAIIDVLLPQYGAVAFAIYCTLRRYNCPISERQMAAHIGAGRRTIREALAAMEAGGWIEPVRAGRFRWGADNRAWRFVQVTGAATVSPIAERVGMVGEAGAAAERAAPQKMADFFTGGVVASGE